MKTYTLLKATSPDNIEIMSDVDENLDIVPFEYFIDDIEYLNKRDDVLYVIVDDYQFAMLDMEIGIKR